MMHEFLEIMRLRAC
jgi:hypothetical protein